MIDGMKRGDFRHLERLRVRWVEVDLQKIVFNGHYLMYFDTAVAGYWRAMALPYEAALKSLDGDLFVRKASVEYEGSARYDELIEVGIRCQRVGRTSFTLAAAVFRGEQRLVHGELVYVFADPATQTSREIPPPLRQMLDAYESGAAMVEVSTGDWSTQGASASTVRHAVFVQEQGVPAEIERDDADAGCVHALARNRLGQVVGTGRLLPSEQGVARVGRMAALGTVRGAGVGAALLRALIEVARQRGDHLMRLHAQASAIGFYARQGFAPQGERFVEAGIVHQTMARGL